MNQQLVDNNFMYVPGFLSKQDANNLAQEFFIAQQEGKLNLDSQCPNSPAIYNLLPCVKLLVKKISEVSKIAEEELLPTYTYGRIYSTGEVLNRHRDRDACEVSITLNLKQSGKSWPIWIQKPNGEEISFDLKEGDAIIYLGCTADHWRDKFEGETHVQVFLHYVRANGPKSYAYFDKERR